MAKMYKTPIYLNMSAPTTVQTIGSRKVNIRTQRQENWRITVVLTILMSGEKLALYQILKKRKERYRNKTTANRVCRE